ncbi:hypothetical protein QMK47_24620 [Pseudomonas sp. P9_35]|uniref:hypothetical protein n=1 Tax=unclassified Pseudomonas TaxID=196821 RepID=UPI002A36D57B|nr:MULTISPECIES: hypothetical protein [unclassified Pseudomonas]WPN62671.1 hypothetical protein QMK48_23720 [Pseudomonas sp. P9_32]WPN68426.1 hypothetical protein QMK47_24620 [Pseudomonas sp. P9_35]
MSIQIQSSASWTETLRSRKNHLTALLKIMDMKTGKTTKVQSLTVDLIKAEMSRVDSQLSGRK